MYKLYSANNQVIVSDASVIISQINCNAARLQIIDGIVYLFDLFNKPNALGHTYTTLGNLSTIKKYDGSTGFATNNDLYLYYNTEIGSGSGSTSVTSGLKLFYITTTDGVLDTSTNVVTGTSTFALPTDCDITSPLNKPMIVLNPGRVNYTISGTNGAAFITFSEAPIAGDVPEVYYTVI